MDPVALLWQVSGVENDWIPGMISHGFVHYKKGIIMDAPMYASVKKRLMCLVSFFFLNATCVYAAPPLSTTAEACRQASMQLDWLSRGQTRKDCSANLSDDAMNVYFVSKYILANELQRAQSVLGAAIIRTNFIIDVGCDGRPSIEAVLVDLNNIMQAIS